MPQNTDEQQNTALLVLKQWDAMSKYKKITSIAELERVIKANEKILEMSLDTETTGLDVITAKCLGYSFSFEPHTAFWVPIEIDPQLKRLKRLVKRKTIIFFNAGYDLAIVEKYGVKIPEKNVRDVMIACFFRDIPDYKFKMGLKKQAKEILSLPTVELKDIIAANTGEKVKSTDVDFTTLKAWQQRVYGCQDADITLMLWREKSIQDAVEMMPEIWELEHQLIRPVMLMYRNGMALDIPKCEEFDVTLERICAKLNNDVHKIALRDCATITDKDGQKVFKNDKLRRLTAKKGVNLGSTTQKRIILFDELKLPKTHLIKTGLSTDQRALTEIEDSHEVVGMLKQYAKFVSRRNSYTKKMVGLVNSVTGRIHPTLWPTGARSGRFTCSKPNMQGISSDRNEKDPVHIREMFVAKKGNIITAADYSQIELRVAASDSQEPVWCDAYNEGNIDVHRETGASMYEIPFADVTTFQRDLAKRANFAILTGTSAFMLSARYRESIPNQKKGQEVIDRWFSALPRLSEWIKEVKQRAVSEKEARTYFGRIRPLPEIANPSERRIAETTTRLQTKAFSGHEAWAFDDNTPAAEWRRLAIVAIRNANKRRAVSHFIQGTAADIVKIAIVRVARAIHKEKMPVKMTLQVHDELLFEHPPEITDEIDDLLHEKMEFKAGVIGPGWVPFTVDIGHGNNWAEAH